MTTPQEQAAPASTLVQQRHAHTLLLPSPRQHEDMVAYLVEREPRARRMRRAHRQRIPRPVSPSRCVSHCRQSLTRPVHSPPSFPLYPCTCVSVCRRCKDRPERLRRLLRQLREAGQRQDQEGEATHREGCARAIHGSTPPTQELSHNLKSERESFLFFFTLVAS